MMKLKKIILLGVFAVVGCCMLAGCEDEGEYIDVSDDNEERDESFSFLYNGYNIEIGAEWAGVWEKLGDYNSTFVAESCAYQGTDRYYYYNDFEIMTSEIDGKEIITNIFIESVNVKAVNDICVGMGLSDIAKSMGPADKSTENGLIYYGHKENVQINTKDDKVVSIEYYYVQD